MQQIEITQRFMRELRRIIKEHKPKKICSRIDENTLDKECPYFLCFYVEGDREKGTGIYYEKYERALLMEDFMHDYLDYIAGNNPEYKVEHEQRFCEQ